MAQPEKRADKRIPYEHTVVFRSETTIMESALDISNIRKNNLSLFQENARAHKSGWSICTVVVHAESIISICFL